MSLILRKEKKTFSKPNLLLYLQLNETCLNGPFEMFSAGEDI